MSGSETFVLSPVRSPGSVRFGPALPTNRNPVRSGSVPQDARFGRFGATEPDRNGPNRTKPDRTGRFGGTEPDRTGPNR